MRRLLLALLLSLPLPAAAQPGTLDGAPWPSPRPWREDVAQSPWARLQLRADLQSLFHFKNDSDFDRTAPLYDESGQTVGAFATIFTPRATLHILDNLRIYYEVELGLNFWSKQNPDQQDALAADIFVLKHREIYGEGELGGGKGGFKVGYAHLRDPTGLFLAHWVGMAAGWRRIGQRVRMGYYVGQVPDQTYEGILLDENNFKRDIWVFGNRLDVLGGDTWQLSSGVNALVDTHLVDQMRWAVVPTVHAELNVGRFAGFLDLALQAGQQRGQALDGSDQLHLAWAAQGGVSLALGRLELQATALALSPDDAHDGNDRSHAFLYSGKSRSATLMLTEDELRDWYDNLDERAGGFRGGFYQNRAGLFVGDVKTSYRISEIFRPSLVVGAATVLKPKNALEQTFVGVELDGVLEVTFSDYLTGHAVVGVLVPGGAGGALINRIVRDATDPVVMTELSLTLRY